MIITLFIVWFYFILTVYYKVFKMSSKQDDIINNLISQFETSEVLDQCLIDYINDNNNYDKLIDFKTYIVHKIDKGISITGDYKKFLNLKRFLNLYEQTYNSHIMRELLLKVFIDDYKNDELKKYSCQLNSTITFLIKYPKDIDLFKYKYFIKINNQFYKTEEFEVSFLHFLLLNCSDIEYIDAAINKHSELINDNNNKYKLYPIHCVLLNNNYKTFIFVWKKINKNQNKLNLYANIFTEDDKLDDNLFDVFGYNLLEFSMLNKCDYEIVYLIFKNFKYNIYQLNNQNENIITLLIRVDNKEYYRLFHNLGYTYYNILNGIVFFAQGKINNKNFLFKKINKIID